MVAYWIAHVDVSDPEAYEAYRSANALAFNKFKGRFIVRGGKSKVVEGNVRSRRSQWYPTAITPTHAQQQPAAPFQS